MKRLAFVALLGFLVLLAACTTAEPETESTVELSVTTTDLAFDVERLEVITGQSVKLTLHNEGSLEHDFSIMEIPHTGEVMVEESNEMAGEGHDMGSMSEEPEIHVAAISGSSSTIEFTPSTAGEYPFFCAVAGHREAGMNGVLVVKAP